MIKDTDIGFLKMIYLLYLTAKQEKALVKGNLDEYMKLMKKHFNTYFGLDMIDVALYCPDCPEAKALLHKHGCMVVDTVFPYAPKLSKKKLYKMAKETFISNLLLEEDL